MGSLIYIWKAAEIYWVPDCKPIPVSIYKQLLNSEIFEKVGLVKRKRDGFYVGGSRDLFAWLCQKVDAGRKSAKSRRKKGNGTPTELNGSEPPLLSSLIISSQNSEVDSKSAIDWKMSHEQAEKNMKNCEELMKKIGGIGLAP